MLYYIGNTESFNKLIQLPVTICMFTASWCKPCLQLKPKVIAYGESHKDVPVAIVDVDTMSSLAQFYFINSVPTFLVFKNGTLTKRFQISNPDTLETLFDNSVNSS